MVSWSESQVEQPGAWDWYLKVGIVILGLNPQPVDLTKLPSSSVRTGLTQRTPG
jgi:hypothetical protein